MYWPANYSYNYYQYNPAFLPYYPPPSQVGAGPSSTPVAEQDENDQPVNDDSYIYYVKLINPKRAILLSNTGTMLNRFSTLKKETSGVRSK